VFTRSDMEQSMAEASSPSPTAIYADLTTKTVCKDRTHLAEFVIEELSTSRDNATANH